MSRPLCHLPREVWDEVEATPVPGTSPSCYDVVVPLWTDQGPAGVGVQIRLVPTRRETFVTEVWGFRPVEMGAGPWSAPVRQSPGDRAGPRPVLRVPSGDPVPERWRPLVGWLVHRLAEGEYAGLAHDGFVSRIDDPEDAGIGLWIERYPATLVDLPGEAWAFSDHWAIDEGVWAVVVELWTAEEGHSDLSMEATVWDDGTEIIVKIDGVHVM